MVDLNPDGEYMLIGNKVIQKTYKDGHWYLQEVGIYDPSPNNIAGGPGEVVREGTKDV